MSAKNRQSMSLLTLLCILLLLTLLCCGCAQKIESSPAETASVATAQTEEPENAAETDTEEQEAAARYFQKELHEITVGLYGVGLFTVRDGEAACVGLRSFPLSESGIPTLLLADIATGEKTYYTLPVPAGAEFLAAVENGRQFWTLYSFFDSESEAQKIGLCAFDETGTASVSLDLTGLLEQHPQLTSAAGLGVLSDGRILLALPSELLLLSESGVLETAIASEDTILGLTLDEIGSPVCLLERGDEEEDADISGALAEISLTEGSLTVLTETEPLAGCQNGYVWSESALYQLEGRKLRRICDWADAGLTAPALLSVTEEALWTLYASYNSATQLMEARFCEEAEKAETKTLTLAVVQQPVGRGLDSLASDFMLTYPEYELEIWDYTEEENPVKALYTDILAGKVPDLYCLEGLSLQSMVSAGLLLDCSGLLENSEVVSQSDIISGVWSAMTYDGGLYRVSPSVQLVTMIGSQTVFGDASSVTLEDLNEAWAALSAQNPDAIRGYGSAELLLPNLLYCTMERFVDWSTGTCSFDSTEFMELLTFVRDNQEAYTANSFDGNALSVQNGESMTFLYSLSSLEQLVKLKTVMTDGYALLGFPPEGTVCSLTCPLGISASAEDQEGAWALLEFLLSESYQSQISGAFPVREDVLTETFWQMNTAISYYDSDGNETVLTRTLEINHSTIEVELLTQEDLDALLRCFEGITATLSDDKTLISIIYEEALPYLNGQKTVEETAAIIQSRAQVYVDERYE